MQSLKGSEQLACSCHVEAGAVVAHEKDLAVVFPTRAHLDVGVVGFVRVLPCVVEEILEQDAQKTGVAACAQAALHVRANVAVRIALAQQRESVSGQRGEIDVLEAHFGAGDA